MDYDDGFRLVFCGDEAQCGEHGGTCEGHWSGYALPA